MPARSLALKEDFADKRLPLPLDPFFVRERSKKSSFTRWRRPHIRLPSSPKKEETCMQHARATDQSHELSMLVRRRCSRLARNLRSWLLISARGVGLQKNDATQQKHLCPVALQKLPVKKPRETRRVCEEPEASYAWLMLIAINDDSHLITCKRHFTLGATSSPTFLQRQPLSIIRNQYYCCCVTHSILPMCSFRYNRPHCCRRIAKPW